MKKLLAVLLVLCLFVGMMPMAFAAGTPDDYVELIEPVEPTESTEPAEPVVPTEPAEEVDDTENVPKVDYYDGHETTQVPISEVKDKGNPNFAKARNTNTKVYYKYVSDALNNAKSGETVEVLTSTEIRDNTVKEGVTLSLEEGVTLTIIAGCTLTVNGTIDDKYGKIEGNVDKGDTPDEGDGDGEETTPPEEGGGEEPEVPPVISLYPVTFDVPSWVDIVVTDSNGTECSEFKHHVWSLPDGEYNYTLSYDGVEFGKGSFEVNGSPLHIDEDWAGPAWRVIVKPSSHGDVWVNDRYANYGEYVKIYVDPDTGYYLSNLTVTTVNGSNIDVWRVESNVYEFKMPADRVVVDADFAYTPSEYRVYIANTEHGTVSVDTRYAEEGEWVYITVNPNAGYRLSDLTVTRPSGNTVKVEHVRGNVFRFAMPGVRVTVDAEFVRTTMPFTDVSRGQWFYDAVSFVYWRDIMDGVTSTQFAPDATTTRAMVVQILYRMAGSPTVRGSSPFYDVSNGAWYADAVIWAEANDIVNGMTTTTFAPNTAVTREQLATMLYRYAQYRHYNTSAGANTNILSYYDANRISEYAFSALQWACGEGVMDGTGTGYLSPQGQATRAQLAAMLMRFCMEYRI